MQRDVMLWLFRPDPLLNGYFIQKKTDLLTLSPFAYFNQSLDLLYSVTSTATSTPLTLTIPTQWGNVPILNTNDVKTSSMWVDVSAQILFWERIVLWLFLMFWIFERLRDYKP
jgi:hypothetical protein